MYVYRLIQKSVFPHLKLYCCVVMCSGCHYISYFEYYLILHIYSLQDRTRNNIVRIHLRFYSCVAICPGLIRKSVFFCVHLCVLGSFKRVVMGWL